MLRARGMTSVTLGGWSYGGVVSIALAPLLEAAGIHVRAAIMLDSPLGQCRHQRALVSDGNDMFSHEEDAVAALVSGLEKHGKSGLISGRALEHFKHCTTLLDSFDESKLPQLQCPLVDIRPVGGSDCDFMGGLHAAGAEALTSKGLYRHVAEGTHWTLLDGKDRINLLASVFMRYARD